MTVSSILLILAALILLSWGVGAYQRLMRQRRQCRALLEPLVPLLAHRHEPVVPLVETARAFLKEDRQLLEETVTALNAAIAATAALPRAPLDAVVVERAGAAEETLGGKLAALEAALHSVTPGTPTLDPQLQRLLDDLAATEESIAVARTVYNHAAGVYNTARAQFPGVIVAVVFAFRPVGLLRAASSRRPA